MAIGMFLLLKNLTKSSMSLMEAPPVDTITGLLVEAIFSIKGQSFKSELAILIIGKSNSSQRSTDASSKGVAIGIQPLSLIAFTSVLYCSFVILVSSVFFIYLISDLFMKSLWMK